MVHYGKVWRKDGTSEDLDLDQESLMDSCQDLCQDHIPALVWIYIKI